jgi:hypothetical protein
MDTRVDGPLAGLLLGVANTFGATALVWAALYGLGCIAATLRRRPAEEATMRVQMIAGVVWEGLG